MAPRETERGENRLHASTPPSLLHRASSCPLASRLLVPGTAVLASPVPLHVAVLQLGVHSHIYHQSPLPPQGTSSIQAGLEPTGPPLQCSACPQGRTARRTQVAGTLVPLFCPQPLVSCLRSHHPWFSSSSHSLVPTALGGARQITAQMWAAPRCAPDGGNSSSSKETGISQRGQRNCLSLAAGCQLLPAEPSSPEPAESSVVGGGMLLGKPAVGFATALGQGTSLLRKGCSAFPGHGDHPSSGRRNFPAPSSPCRAYLIPRAGCCAEPWHAPGCCLPGLRARSQPSVS